MTETEKQAQAAREALETAFREQRVGLQGAVAYFPSLSILEITAIARKVYRNQKEGNKNAR